ncbi:MAG: epoxide hydrolase [Pseudonocardia sp.]|nr:epoxide hydrolase [Pseudonocardia sp.]
METCTVSFPAETLDDLRDRLARTRWPDAETVDDWSQGTPLAWARDLAAYWANGYDLGRVPARLAGLPQFRTEIDGLGVHFLHIRSPHADATPLLLTHGWPSTVLEFLDVVGPLTHAADPREAFHLVIPSLPGHGFSDRPSSTGWTVTRTARAWAELMARLGYDRYVAHGGDWGSWISGILGAVDPEHVLGAHMTMPMAQAPDEPVDLDERDLRAMERMRSFGAKRSAYAAVQSTRPQTFGYGLTDSPVGQLAWIAERFWEWADHGGRGLEHVVSRDVLLDTVTTYWVTGTATSAARLFWESFTGTVLPPVTVPVGCSVFPNDAWMPRAWCARRFSDLRYWRDLDAGGHFPAIETPDVLVAELRAFRATLG